MLFLFYRVPPTSNKGFYFHLEHTHKKKLRTWTGKPWLRQKTKHCASFVDSHSLRND
jgi:hypothetical protein